MIDPTKTMPEKLAEMNDSLIVDNNHLRERIRELEVKQHTEHRLLQVTKISIPTDTMKQFAASEIRLATDRLRKQLSSEQNKVKVLTDALDKAAKHIRPTCTELYDQLQGALTTVRGK